MADKDSLAEQRRLLLNIKAEKYIHNFLNKQNIYLSNLSEVNCFGKATVLIL